MTYIYKVCSLHFIRRLKSAFYLQSAFYAPSTDCSLRFTLTGDVKLRPSHGKLRLAKSFWQTRVFVSDLHKNCRQRDFVGRFICKDTKNRQTEKRSW